VRFIVLVAGAAATGAVTVGAIQAMFPQAPHTFRSVRELGGDLANVKMGEINPVKTHQEVRRQITSGERPHRTSWPDQAPPNSIDSDTFRPSFKIHGRETQRSITAGANGRAQQEKPAKEKAPGGRSSARNCYATNDGGIGSDRSHLRPSGLMDDCKWNSNSPVDLRGPT
jgi:hypothetical protein